MTDRLRCLRSFAGGRLATPGLRRRACVPADPSKPWSTRDQSLTTVEDGDRIRDRRPMVIEASSEPAPGYAARRLGDRVARMSSRRRKRSVPRRGPVVLRPERRRRPEPPPGCCKAVVDLSGADRPGERVRSARRRIPRRSTRSRRFGLIDENRGVRFVATMSVGDAGLDGLAPLIAPLVSDPSDSVRAAAIYAMNALGEGADPSPLGGDGPQRRSRRSEGTRTWCWA